jgi:hypothetical protein
MNFIKTRNCAKSILILCAAALLLTAAGVAQEPPPPPRGLPFAGGPGGMMGGEFGDQKTVTGAPLTAVLVVTRDTTLADGNKIHNESQSKMYRDTEGRVRRELAVDLATTATGKVNRNFIVINDPVAGKRYMLNPDNKTAHAMPQRGARHANSSGDPANATPGSEGPGGPDGPGNVTKEQLGTKTVNGVQAEGVRVTRTIPAGAIGNDKPIEVVTERWYSPDLQMTVMMTHTDPMMGTVTAKMVSVVRGDPDPNLFQVPSDYKLETGRPNQPMFMPNKP